MGSWSVLTVEGPLWFRGTSQWNDRDRRQEMLDLLDAIDVRRLITGQGVEQREIRCRFNNRVLVTSVDMADGPYGGGGVPAALEIADGVYSVVTMRDREVLIDDRR